MLYEMVSWRSALPDRHGVKKITAGIQVTHVINSRDQENIAVSSFNRINAEEGNKDQYTNRNFLIGMKIGDGLWK